jgi:hypothetical protein
MGGTYSGVWGALGGRTIPVPSYGIEAEGRWAAVGIRGRELARKIAFVSVYREPRGLGGEGANLETRYGRLFGLASAAAAHSRFYADLGEWISRLRADGFEVCVGGDFNADLDRDRAQNRLGGDTLGGWLAEVALYPIDGSVDT